MVAAIRELGEGWNVFPCDSMDRGVLGYCAVRSNNEEHTFEWPLFGRELAPEVELVEATDLLDFVKGVPTDQLYPCDDPYKRLWGFVSYSKAPEGQAIVRRSKLSSIKGLAPHPRAVLMEAHERQSSHKMRSAAAKAIKPHGRLMVWAMRLVRRFLPLR